ncbi:MAG: glucuronate isomerase [Treponema sp.]|nr:glucuronate isomerase [Treponema sp.]
MHRFMDKDFLLSNRTAHKLYHEAAADEPIFDYHCHLNPEEIAQNRRFTDLAQVWLGEGTYGDHYKWRALRANGVDEALITGTGADPYERFLAWAATVPRLIGNPLYHWTHLELQRYFDIHEPLNKESAPDIWRAANQKLAKDQDLSVQGIFRKFRVHAVGTTDDPADSLEWHKKIAAQGAEGSPEGQAPGPRQGTKVLPSFRPDRVLGIDKEGFAAYIAKLGEAAGKEIASFSDLLEALTKRIDFFDEMGCRAADHGLEYFPFETASDGSTFAEGSALSGVLVSPLWKEEVAAAFSAALAGEKLDRRTADSYKTLVLGFLARCYSERGWVMQIHIGALRNNNTRMFRLLGADTGFDAVHDHNCAANLARFLDILDQVHKLPKTILYSLNIKDFYPLATIMGSFQGGGLGTNIPGKMQLGSSWWHLDHKDGMEAMMKLLGNVGLLSRFVGMLTDSRSFLSYPRHEYFRRILCNLLGTWAEAGEIPNDYELLSLMVKDISFRNAKEYFGE